MKKLIFCLSLIIVTLTTSLSFVKASNNFLLVSYKQMEEGEEFVPGYYLVQVKFADKEASNIEDVYDEVTNKLVDNGSFMAELLNESTDRILMGTFGIACGNETVRQKIAEVIEEGGVYYYGLVLEMYNELTYEDMIEILPEHKEIYSLSFTGGPIFEDPSGSSHILNYDEHFTLEDIKSRYTATDDYDKDLTSQIQFESNFPTSEQDYKIGTYYIKATVKDSAGNVATVTNDIYLLDITKPKFNVEVVSLEYKFGSTIPLEVMFKDITCIDNYEGEIPYNKWKLSSEITNTITSLQEVTVSYTDGSGNSSSFVLKVVFKDTTKPVIKVDAIELSSTNPLKEEELVKLFVSQKNIDPNYINYELTTDYFKYSNKLGIYDSTLSLTYSNNEVMHYQFQIKVVEDITNDSPNYIPYIISGGLVIIIMAAGIAFYFIKKKCS